MYLGQQSWAQQQAKGSKSGGKEKGKGKGSKSDGKGCGKKGGKSAEVGSAPGIKLVGCKDSTVGPIIRGEYKRDGENHGRPAYKKPAVGPEGLTVLIYFWDERDGAAASGWWIGPSIGGNMVWGHHPNRTSATPPTSGWLAPHNAPEDYTVVLSPTGGAASQQHQQHGKGGKTPVIAPKVVTAPKVNQEELKAKQAEQNAAMAIRKEIAKLKAATPSTIEKLKEDLAIAMGTEFDKCGSLQSAVQIEHDKALALANERVEKMQEAEKKREAAREGGKKLVVELTSLVAEAEQANQDLAAQLKALGEKSDLTTEDVINSACVEVESVVESVAVKAKAAQDFLKEKGTEIRNAFPGGGKNNGAAKETKVGEDEDFSTLSRRANGVRGGLEKEIAALKRVKRKLLARAAASTKLRDFNGTFTKYDKDKDGHLNRKEIAALAKGEYGFGVADESLDMICKVFGAGKGVKADEFHRLLVTIGAARERVLDLERRADREVKEAERAESKKKVADAIEEVNVVLKAATAAVSELVTKKCALPKDSKDMTSPQMLAKVAELEAEATGAVGKMKLAREETEKFASVTVDAAFAGWAQNEKERMQRSVQKLDDHMTQARTTIRTFKDGAALKEAVEVRALGNKVLKRLRAHLKEQKSTPAALFKEIAKGADGLKAAAFVAFAPKLSKAADDKDEELSADDLSRAFGFLDEERTGAVSVDTFNLLLRCVMKVVKDVALTATLPLADSKAIRRLEAGEVVELLEGPVQEDGLDRVRCRTMQGGLEGWATMKGNQGSVFLKEGGHTFKVLKETILTEAFDIAAASTASKIHETTRKAKVGELFDIREWGQKHEGSGLTRMKCRMQSDGAIGWITSIGNTGIRFVDML